MKKTKKRGVKFAVAALVVVALAVWISSRWHAWFSIPDEPPYTAVASPDRVMLTLGDSTELSRNVSWQCGDTVAEAWLELKRENDSVITRIDADGEVYASRNGKAAYYVARLRELAADTRYAYRVATGSQFSEWYSFRTQSLANRDVTFMYMGDVQDTVGGLANLYLKEAMARNSDTELFVCGGDLVERPADKYWAEAFRDLESVRQSMPVLCVAGNHDYLKTVPDSTERRFPLVFSYFLDSHVGDNLVATFNYGNVQFFLLDSNRYPINLRTQRKWLEEKLSLSKAKWKVVIVHHPMYSISGTYNNLVQRAMFDDLIRIYGVDVVLQAHEHAYARMTEYDEDEKVTPVYTVSHCSPKHYKIKRSERYDKYGETGRYYQMVRTHGDSLSLSAYDVTNHQLYDSLTIVKRQQKKPAVIDHGLSIPES